MPKFQVLSHSFPNRYNQRVPAFAAQPLAPPSQKTMHHAPIACFNPQPQQHIVYSRSNAGNRGAAVASVTQLPNTMYNQMNMPVSFLPYPTGAITHASPIIHVNTACAQNTAPQMFVKNCAVERPPSHIYLGAAANTPEVFIDRQPWTLPPNKVVIHKQTYTPPTIFVENTETPAPKIIVHSQDDPPPPEIFIREEPPPPPAQIFIRKKGTSSYMDPKRGWEVLVDAEGTANIPSHGVSQYDVIQLEGCSDRKGAFGVDKESRRDDSSLEALERQRVLLLREKERLRRRLAYQLQDKAKSAEERGYSRPTR